MSHTWDPTAPGVMALPSGRSVRGRGLRHGLPEGPHPQFGLYLLGRPVEFDWEHRWVRWKDFWLPSDRHDFAAAARQTLEYAATQRVEVACGGGKGRTGTALACLAILDGAPAELAVDYVRESYSRHAVETPWQRKFVARFQ